MTVPVAVASVVEVCGEPGTGRLLCRWLYEETGSELAARAGLVVTTAGRIVAILLAAWVLSRLLRRYATRLGGRFESTLEARLERSYQRGAITDTQRFRGRRLQRLHATIGVIRGVLGTAVWAGAVLLVLSQELGVRLQPILAGAGLVGVIIGFGAQQLVRDVIAGIAMLIEDQYGVGDWIEVDGKFGAVERVGLRSTAFRDVDGVVHHVLNGYIQRVGNLSQEWARATFDVPVALDADLTRAKALILEVATGLVEDPVWAPDIIGPPEIWGVQAFGPSGVQVRVVIPTKPLRNWDVTRQLRERLKNAFDDHGIRMPPQLVDLGGQRFTYPVMFHATEATLAPEGRSVPRQDLQARPTPADSDPCAPQGDPVGPTSTPQPSRRELGLPDDVPVELPQDATQQLRIVRGPQPRPD